MQGGQNSLMKGKSICFEEVRSLKAITVDVYPFYIIQFSNGCKKCDSQLGSNVSGASVPASGEYWKRNPNPLLLLWVLENMTTRYFSESRVCDGVRVRECRAKTLQPEVLTVITKTRRLRLCALNMSPLQHDIAQSNIVTLMSRFICIRSTEGLTYSSPFSIQFSLELHFEGNIRAEI